MSVINKMLRDLDARRAGGSLPELQRQGGPDALQGTVSVAAAAPSSVAQGRRWWLATVLLFAGSGLAAWYILEGAVEQPPASLTPAVVTVAPAASAPVAPMVAPAPEPAASAPADSASAPLAAASGVAPAPAVVASAAQPAASAPVPAPPAKRPSDGAAAAIAPQPRVPASPAAREAQRRPAERPARDPAPVAQPAPVKAPVPAAAPAQRRQAVAEETLARAQALWAAGSREAAVELVREVTLLAERSQPSDATLLAMLVREQTRMELALGRPAAVLELLTRLEPQLSTQADLWAVRGNAAQRLGRHPESVQAYLMALQLRPGESRWMLGAAVSLAAQGQLDAAAQQAERARALGPVSPEVLNYLRQAGVPLR